MRVAVHTDDGTVFAYRLGRIHDDVDVITGETRTRDSIAKALVLRAKEEYPNAEVVIERLEGDDETSEWVKV